MADLLNSFGGRACSSVLTEAQNTGATVEIPFVVLEGDSDAQTNPVSATDSKASDDSEKEAQCCPLADLVARLQQVLKTLSSGTGRPAKPALLMRTVYELVEHIDRTYAGLEQSVKAEMARLQLPMIGESNEKQLLIARVKDIIDREDFEPVMRQLLADSSPWEDDSILETVVLRHPEVALIVERLANHQQPITIRFQHLQRQLNHSSIHRVKERKKIAGALEECGLIRLARKMKEEAISIEMGC
jgi:hypothetical protein